MQESHDLGGKHGDKPSSCWFALPLVTSSTQSSCQNGLGTLQEGGGLSGLQGLGCNGPPVGKKLASKPS